ncbi:FYVE-domain-containing protein, partial [Clavulina sp. PMI_390]
MLHYSGELYKLLQKEGFNFPPKDYTSLSAAMVDSQAPPEWIDSDVCLRCRTPFSFTNRKHHCRSCGLVFDQQCSSKVLPLPHLGIDQPVRVCDGCFVKVGPKKLPVNGSAHHRSASTSRVPSSNPASSHGLAHSNTVHASSRSARKSAQQQADEDLQRAIQMSLEEAGMTHGPRNPNYVPQPETPGYEVSEPPLVDSSAAVANGEYDDDPDLKAAIEASLREANAPKPSAPVAMDEPSYAVPGAYQPTHSHTQPLPSYDLNDHQADAIMTFSQVVETAQSRGAAPDFVRHQEVGNLYHRTGDIAPLLERSLDDAGRREQILSEMNQKLSQAARLYDQLLTTQVSNSPAALQSPGAATAYAQPFYTPPPLPQQTYAAPPVQVPQQQYAQYAQPYAPQQQQQQAYYQQPQLQSMPPPPTLVQSPPPMSANTWQATPQSPQQQLSSPTPAPIIAPPAPPTLVASPPPPSQSPYQYSTSPVQAPAAPAAPALVQSPPPMTAQPQEQQPQLYQPQQHQQLVQQTQGYALPMFPAVPNEPLPVPVQPQAEPREAMLISF